MDRYCTICGIIAEVSREWEAVVYSHEGIDIALFERIRCAAGHSYDHEVKWDELDENLDG